jgi:hypothetical protein
MGLRDKFNDLAKQAKDAVAEHNEQIHEVVEQVSVAADAKTHSKYTAKIAKVGGKASAAVDKLGAGGGQSATNEPTGVDDSGATEGDHSPPPPTEFPSFDDGPSAEPPAFDSATGASDDDPDQGAALR